jgi:RNA-binding protein YhbY
LSKITTRMKRHVRYKLKDENPTIWIGKDGLTPQLSHEIENQLEKKKMLKIKILKRRWNTTLLRSLRPRLLNRLAHR